LFRKYTVRWFSYVGPNLPGSGIQTCDDLTLAIQKLDNKLILLQNAIYRATTTTTTTIFCTATTTTTTENLQQLLLLPL
jgi:hypothetical protein